MRIAISGARIHNSGRLDCPPEKAVEAGPADRFVAEQPLVDQAVYARVLVMMKCELGMSQAELLALQQAYPEDRQLQAFLGQGIPEKEASGQTRDAAEIKKDLLQRLGEILLKDCRWLGEKYTVQSGHLAQAAKDLEASDRLGAWSPKLSAMASVTLDFGQGVQALGDQSDPGRAAAALVGISQKTVDRLKLAPLRNLGMTMAPEEAIENVGIHLMQASQNAAACTQRGDLAEATAWGTAARMNSMAANLRSTCSLAATFAALSGTGPAPSMAPLLANCRQIGGVLNASYPWVAKALNQELLL